MALLTADEIIEIATRLEERGEAFYADAASRTSSTEVASLFEDLALQEQYHRRVFQQMGRDVVELALSPEQWDQFQAYAGALLQQDLFDKPEGALSQAREALDEQQALEAALGFEKETLLFFHELRDVVRGSERKTVERIIQEEKQHVQRLSAMLAAT
jgi:rubrerythrin